jgi:predicted N-acetyltransferase YhbS
LSTSEIASAARLIDNQWGAQYSRLFEAEALQLSTRPYSATLGAFDRMGTLLGNVVLAKADIDYSLWGLAWLVVAQPFQKRGIGKELITAAIQHARAHQHHFPESSTVLQLTTRTPDYFSRLGFKSATSWEKDGGRSHLMIFDTSTSSTTTNVSTHENPGKAPEHSQDRFALNGRSGR